MAHTSHVCPYPLLCGIPAASSRLSCADRPVGRLLQDQHVEGKTRGKQGVCERKGILRTKACPGPHWCSCQHGPHARDRCFSALVGACVKAGPSRAPDRARLGPSALGLAAPVPKKQQEAFESPTHCGPGRGAGPWEPQQLGVPALTLGEHSWPMAATAEAEPRLSIRLSGSPAA